MSRPFDGTFFDRSFFDTSAPVLDDEIDMQPLKQSTAIDAAFYAMDDDGAGVTGSIANNTAVVSWIAVDITSQSWSYSFTYQII